MRRNRPLWQGQFLGGFRAFFTDKRNAHAGLSSAKLPYRAWQGGAAMANGSRNYRAPYSGPGLSLAENVFGCLKARPAPRGWSLAGLAPTDCTGPFELAHATLALFPNGTNPWVE